MFAEQLGNRLFESLRVSIIPSISYKLQRQPVSPAGIAIPDNQERLLSSTEIAAGGDIDVQCAARGFVFELETTSGEGEYRHIYVSKPLLIDYLAAAPASALDLTICFARTRILDSSGSRIQQHSAMYRHLSRHQPPEFCVQAEVVGWAQQSITSLGTASCEGASLACEHGALTNIKRHMWSTCVRTVRIFAPFWLVNRQPEALFVSYCHRPIQFMSPFDWRLLGVPSEGKAYLALGVAPDDEATNFSSHKDFSSGALAEDIRAARSRKAPVAKLCSAFRADIVGRPTAVSVPTQVPKKALFKQKGKKCLHFGVTAALAPPPFSRSRVISIHSRFVLKNCLPCDIWVRESSGSTRPLRLSPGFQIAFHPEVLGPRGEALICITKTDPVAIESLVRRAATSEVANSPRDGESKAQTIEKAVWSAQLTVARSASFQIRVKKPMQTAPNSFRITGSHAGQRLLVKEGRALSWEYHNIQVQIRSLESASFVVVFSEPAASEYLLVNNTNHIIAFAQSGLRSKSVWEILERGQQLEYAWTEPQRERKYLRFSFRDHGQKVVKTCDIARVRAHRPLTLLNSKEKIYFVTEVSGSRRRVTITHDAPQGTIDTSSAARNVWRSLQHDIFRIRRNRKKQRIGKDADTRGPGLPRKKAFLPSHVVPAEIPRQDQSFTAVSHRPSQAAVLKSQYSAESANHPCGKTEVTALATQQRTRHLENTSNRAKNSSKMTHKGTLSPKKKLRFQQMGTKESNFSVSSDSPASSGESSLASSLFEDIDGRVQTNAVDESGMPQSTEENERIRRRGKKIFHLRARSTGESSTSRGVRNAIKGTAKGRRGHGMTHEPLGSSSSSEMNQRAVPSGKSSFAEIGFYVGVFFRGVGISLVDSTPQELAFFGCTGISVELRRLHKASMQDFRMSVEVLQVDNGVPGAQHRTILRHATPEERVELHGEGSSSHTADGSVATGASEGLLHSVIKPSITWNSFEESEKKEPNFFFRLQLGGQWKEEATLLDYLDIELAPIAVHVEADTTYVLMRFLMQLLQNRTFFIVSLQERNVQLVREAAANRPDTSGYQQLRAFPEARVPIASSMKPLYIRALVIRPILLILSTRSQRVQQGHITSGHEDFIAMRQFEVVGDRMTDITNFPLKARLFVQQCVFTNGEQLAADIAYSYIQQCIWQLHKLVASIDVIGNPLRLITGVSSSLRIATAHHSEGTLIA